LSALPRSQSRSRRTFTSAACKTYETLCEARMAAPQERTLELRLRAAGREGGYETR